MSRRTPVGSWAQRPTSLAVPYHRNKDGDAGDPPDERVGQREPEPDPNHPNTTANEVKPSLRAWTPPAPSAADPIRQPTRIGRPAPHRYRRTRSIRRSAPTATNTVFEPAFRPGAGARSNCASLRRVRGRTELGIRILMWRHHSDAVNLMEDLSGSNRNHHCAGDWLGYRCLGPRRCAG